MLTNGTQRKRARARGWSARTTRPKPRLQYCPKPSEIIIKRKFLSLARQTDNSRAVYACTYMFGCVFVRRICANVSEIAYPPLPLRQAPSDYLTDRPSLGYML